MAVVTWIKDPQAVKDYILDWSKWLKTDTISASSWTADAGITIDDDSNTTTRTTVWLSGGTLGEDYEVTNHITTAAGREDERTIKIRVRDQ